MPSWLNHLTIVRFRTIHNLASVRLPKERVLLARMNAGIPAPLIENFSDDDL